MKLLRHTVQLNSGATGNASAFFADDDGNNYLSGLLYTIVYTADPVNPYDPAITVIVNATQSGRELLNMTGVSASFTRYVRFQASNFGGSSISFVGATNIYRAFVLGRDVVSVSVVGAGANNVGKFHLIIAQELNQVGGIFT